MQAHQASKAWMQRGRLHMLCPQVLQVLLVLHSLSYMGRASAVV
jgi:hypothetical protein